MFWSLPASTDSLSFGRMSIRVIVAAALILGVAGSLFYSASLQRDAIHARNLRWLAQSATRIRDKILTYDQIVTRAAEAAKGDKNIDFRFGIAANLKPFNPAPGQTVCPEGLEFCVSDADQGPMARFGHGNRGGQTNLRIVVDESVRTGVFSTLVLARRDGKVLYQSGRDNLRLTNISFLFEKPEALGMMNWLPGSRQTNSTALPQSTVVQSNRADLPTASVHLQRTIGDRELEVYVQPLTIKQGTVPRNLASGAVGEGEWLVLGMIERDSLTSTTSSKNFVLLMPLIIILVAVSWPLPKPWLLAAGEPLRRRDLGRVVICTFGVVLLLSVLGFYHYARVISSVRTDQQLNVLAASIGANLTRETRLGLRQLRELNQLAQAQIVAGEQQWKFKAKLLTYIKSESIHTRFEFVDWVRDNGEKVIRWTPKDQDPVTVSVGDRHYFKDVLTGQTLALPLEDKVTVHFAIEQVLSRTTGQVVTMVAIPSWLPYMKGGGRPLPVASIGLKLASVFHPVLPAGFGFAIVDHEGRVLFHSDETRVLSENLFEECPDSTELPGILDRRVRAAVDANYGGVPHRLLVTPIPGLEIVPWTLVAFRNLEPIQQFRGQGLVDTGALMGAAALLGLIPLGLVYLLLGNPLFGTRKLRTGPKSLFDLAWWTRPLSRYPCLAAAGLLFVIIALRAIQTMQGPGLFYAAIGAGVGFLGLSAWCLRHRCGLLRTSVSGMVGAPLLLALFACACGDWVMAVVAPALMAAAGWALPRLPGVPEQRHNFHRAAWLLWTAQYAFCLCVAPTFFLAKYAYEYETGLHARDLQWRLWRESELRQQQFVSEIDGYVGSDPDERKRDNLMQSVGLPYSPGACPPLFSYPLAGYNTLLLSRDAQPPQPSRPGSGCYWVRPPFAPDPGADCAALRQRASPWRVPSALPNLVLAGAEFAVTGRAMGFDVRQREMQPWLGIWRWCTENTAEGTFLWLLDGKVPVARTDAPTFRPFSLFPISSVNDEDTTGPAALPARIGEMISGLEVWAGLLLLMGALMYWTHRLRVQVLQLGPAFSTESLRSAKAEGRNSLHRLILARAGNLQFTPSESATDYTVIDFASEDPSEYLDGRRLPAGGLLLLHLESRFWDEPARLARLALLEKALIYPDRKMVVISAIDPARYLRTGGAGALGSKAQPAELQRWRRVLNYFSVEGMATSQQTAPSNPAEIWDSCSEQEQLVLAQLERHKLVNPAASDVLLALAGRGLVRRAKSERWVFFDSDFRRFVNFAGFPASAEEVAESASLKKPPIFTIALVLAGVVLFLTQEETTTRMIGFLTSVTGGFEAIRRQIAGGGSPDKKG